MRCFLIAMLFGMTLIGCDSGTGFDEPSVITKPETAWYVGLLNTTWEAELYEDALGNVHQFVKGPMFIESTIVDGVSGELWISKLQLSFFEDKYRSSVTAHWAHRLPNGSLEWVREEESFEDSPYATEWFRMPDNTVVFYQDGVESDLGFYSESSGSIRRHFSFSGDSYVTVTYYKK